VPVRITDSSILHAFPNPRKNLFILESGKKVFQNQTLRKRNWSRLITSFLVLHQLGLSIFFFPSLITRAAQATLQMGALTLSSHKNSWRLNWYNFRMYNLRCLYLGKPTIVKQTKKSKTCFKNSSLLINFFFSPSTCHFFIFTFFSNRSYTHMNKDCFFFVLFGGFLIVLNVMTVPG